MLSEKEKELTLIEHLDELRTRIIISLVSIALCTVVGWFLSTSALDFIIARVGEVQYFAPADAFKARLKMSCFIGFLIASPIVITELWLFVAPGLYAHEKKFVFPAVISSFVLFFSGGAFAISVLGMTISFLEKFGGENMVAHYSVDKFIGFATGFILAFCVVFEIPIILVVLAKIGVVDYKMLAGNRKHAFLIGLVLGAVITPSDPASMLMVAMPLYILFEASLLIIKFMKNNTPTTEDLYPNS